MADEPKLLPCPFCGGEAKIFGPIGWYRSFGISHSCQVFFGGSGDFTIGGKSKEDTIAAWNTRAEPDVAGDEVIADMGPVDVGDIGNYYGGLMIKVEGGKPFWCIENWNGYSWKECPVAVFRALAALAALGIKQ